MLSLLKIILDNPNDEQRNINRLPLVINTINPIKMLINQNVTLFGDSSPF
jgi:hypothetical protein